MRSVCRLSRVCDCTADAFCLPLAAHTQRVRLGCQWHLGRVVERKRAVARDVVVAASAEGVVGRDKHLPCYISFQVSIPCPRERDGHSGCRQAA